MHNFAPNIRILLSATEIKNKTRFEIKGSATSQSRFLRSFSVNQVVITCQSQKYYACGYKILFFLFLSKATLQCSSTNHALSVTSTFSNLAVFTDPVIRIKQERILFLLFGKLRSTLELSTWNLVQIHSYTKAAALDSIKKNKIQKRFSRISSWHSDVSRWHIQFKHGMVSL